MLSIDIQKLEDLESAIKSLNSIKEESIPEVL